MTEHHNAEDDAMDGGGRNRQLYELDNLSARDSDEAIREEEMFRMMQMDDGDDNRASLRENLDS